MAYDSSFTEWLALYRTGDPAAAEELFRRFTPKLIHLARQQLAPNLRSKVDPEDVVQLVYKCFFLRYGNGRLATESWDSLWGLLSAIALRKCADRAEYHRAERRDAAREIASSATDHGPALWQQAPGREPTPLQATILTETVEHLLGSTDEAERPVVEMSLQGYTSREISRHLGRAERTVRRIRTRIKRRLQRQQRENVRTS